MSSSLFFSSLSLIAAAVFVLRADTGHAQATHSPKEYICPGGSDSVDPRVIGDTDIVAEAPLSTNSPERYLALRWELLAYAAAHPTVFTPAMGPVHQEVFPLRGPDGSVVATETLQCPDYDAIFTHEPEVAAIFWRYNYPPGIFMRETITFRKALYAAAVHRTHGVPLQVPDWTVRGRIIRIILAHHEEFANSGLDYAFDLVPQPPVYDIH